ncbi:hypothetical protein OH828_37305 [Streptomyces anulatus]|uniref:hypothetical protein n=1 Tax=Streptomyces anulatus TaxID=1892 RepID=UPI00386FB09E
MRLLLPELADAAQHAVQAVYGMRAADSTATLQEARERALSASDDLVAAAGAALARSEDRHRPHHPPHIPPQPRAEKGSRRGSPATHHGETPG